MRAREFVDKIIARTEILEDFPEVGAIALGTGRKQIREVLESPYRIFYRIHPAIVEVIAIVHASQKLPHL